MIIKIIRIESNKKATRGVMLIDKVPKFLTLELPWRNNEKNISCIPAGTYNMGPHNGVKYKNTFLVKGVPNRGAIICPHIGNTSADTEGCILIGMQFGEFGVAPAVSYSARAMEEFRKITHGLTDITLEIVEV